jgi:hypothetical protein
MAEARPPGTGDRIRVDSYSEVIAITQLAARWSERFAAPAGDAPGAALERFRVAFDYVDAVTHGRSPPEAPGS